MVFIFGGDDKPNEVLGFLDVNFFDRYTKWDSISKLLKNYVGWAQSRVKLEMLGNMTTVMPSYQFIIIFCLLISITKREQYHLRVGMHGEVALDWRKMATDEWGNCFSFWFRFWCKSTICFFTGISGRISSCWWKEHFDFITQLSWSWLP